jgi:hypothetical protein
MAPFGLVAVLACGLLLPVASGPAYNGAFPILAIASALLLVGLQRPGAVRTLLSLRPFVALGRISYGVYLYHLPVFLFVTTPRSGLHGWSLFAVRILITLAVSIASYWLVERPIRRATWAGARTMLAAGAASLAVGSLMVAVPVAAAKYWGVSAASQTRAAIPVGVAASPLQTRPTATSLAPQADVVGAAVVPPVSTLPQLSRPVRILVVGDSTAEATGHGLIEWASAHPTVAQVSLAVSAGCGFVRGGTVASDGKVPFQHNCDLLLDNSLPRDLHDLQPDVVVMLVWARDQAPRRWGAAQTELTPHDPAYLMRLNHDYRAITNEVIATTSAKVIWIRPPAGNSYWANLQTPFTDESAHAIVENVMTQVVNESAGRAELLDLRSWMERDGIAFDHAARPDGLHLTTLAATDVATRWLGPQLVLAATQGTGASAGAAPAAH